MPRPNRLNIVNIPQHITQRGNNRQACFFNSIDYRLYLKLLAVGCKKHQCELHAYVLMTNHVHLLLTPRIPNGASLVIRDVGRDYVRTINRVHGRSGTLWEGRFKASLVDAVNYCLNCYRYIELNPVRAGMVSKPGDYPWSSFRTNALARPNTRITPHECWLSLGNSDGERKAAYNALFGECLSDATLETIRRGLNTGLPTGGKQFASRIEKALAIKLGTGKKGARPKYRK